jgi:hypothetical protein
MATKQAATFELIAPKGDKRLVRRDNAGHLKDLTSENRDRPIDARRRKPLPRLVKAKKETGSVLGRGNTRHPSAS